MNITRQSYAVVTFIALAGIPLAATLFGFGDYFGLNQSLESDQPTSTTYAYLKTDDRCVTLAVARTPSEKKQGLSERENLPTDEGMLFVYEDTSRRGFWMKNMNFAIDIFWLDESSNVVTVKRSAQPSSYPESFYPDQSAKNVIETVAGFAETENINSGDRLTVIGPTSTTPVGC